MFLGGRPKESLHYPIYQHHLLNNLRDYFPLPIETETVLRITINWSDLGARRGFERHLNVIPEW